MNKRQVLYSSLLALGAFSLQAQNVGIGEPNPISKLHVTQTTSADAVFISKTGTGNALELLSSGASNTAAAVLLRNATGGVTLDVSQSNAANSRANILSFNQGLGSGLSIEQRNTGATYPGLFIEQNGSGGFSRGIDISMTGTTNAYGQTIYHAGLGGGSYTELMNAANGIIASSIVHRGLGVGSQIELLNAANTSSVSFLRTEGVGSGLEVELTNPTNTANGSAVFHSGNGTGQYVNLSNRAATNSSIGIHVQYAGSGGGTGGGGNAMEIQQNGTNNNAVDIFTGDPALLPGPGNTTNTFPTLSISHMATGNSSGGGEIKAAVNAINYSEDPTIIAQNLTTTTGSAIEAHLTPTNSAASMAIGIYSRADRSPTNGFGIAIQGNGGNYGVIGGTSTNTASSNFGLYSLTNSGTQGTKSFIIDHPFEPTQKNLRHFSVESNEVLNLYRGIVELDATGRAVVKLPAYFDAINKNATYQLTPIGTGVQPYIAVEEANNEFVVAGAPNTKISWTVHAQRNDPTLRYFEQSRGADYMKAETPKQAQDQGKYLVPEAYGQPKEAGVFYNAAHERRAASVKENAKHQKAMPAQEERKTRDSKPVKPSKINKGR